MYPQAPRLIPDGTPANKPHLDRGRALSRFRASDWPAGTADAVSRWDIVAHGVELGMQRGVKGAPHYHHGGAKTLLVKIIFRLMIARDISVQSVAHPRREPEVSDDGFCAVLSSGFGQQRR